MAWHCRRSAIERRHTSRRMRAFSQLAVALFLGGGQHVERLIGRRHRLPERQEVPLVLRRCRSMPMRMMHVRHMSMLVAKPLMAVQVRVRLAGRIVGPVGVLMVLIVHVTM